MSPEERVWLVFGGLFVAAGLIIMMVVLILNYRAIDVDMDTRMRQAGHVPPEADIERTVMIPTVRMANPDDSTLQYGRHSSGWMHNGLDTYRGEHRRRLWSFGATSATRLLAREGVAV